jgi:hypothetical protein
MSPRVSMLSVFALVAAVFTSLLDTRGAHALRGRDAPDPEPPEPDSGMPEPEYDAGAPAPHDSCANTPFDDFLVPRFGEGIIGEPGMPVATALASHLTPECVAWLRGIATGSRVATIAIAIAPGGRDAVRVVVADGAPRDATIVNFGNSSAHEGITFAAWLYGGDVMHVEAGPSTMSPSMLLCKPDAFLSGPITSSTQAADTLVFMRRTLWWFDAQAYFSPSMFWPLFEGKIVTITYVGNP